jgi:hypothetical protein
VIAIVVLPIVLPIVVLAIVSYSLVSGVCVILLLFSDLCELKISRKFFFQKISRNFRLVDSVGC